MAEQNSKSARLQIANQVLGLIAANGRKFFLHDGRVSHFILAENGKLWFVDAYTQKRIYTAYRRGHWRGFTEGGTLRALVENLTDFIAKGYEFRMTQLGPWPQWICGGDLWGYGESMQVVREQVGELIGNTVLEA